MENTEEKKSNKNLVIGLTIALVIVIALIIFVLGKTDWFAIRNNYGSDNPLAVGDKYYKVSKLGIIHSMDKGSRMLSIEDYIEINNLLGQMNNVVIHEEILEKDSINKSGSNYSGKKIEMNGKTYHTNDYNEEAFDKIWSIIVNYFK